MKNYFKTYYRTRITQGVLGEGASDQKEQMISDALTKHKNIMEGYNPNGRESGIMDPDDRANYIKHFTNFINESYFKGVNLSWTEARDGHNTLVEDHKDAKYLSNFADFMNSPRTNIILETSMLSEEEKQERKSFPNAIVAAVRKHVKNPGKTVSSSRGDNFDVLDIALHAAKKYEYYKKNPPTTPFEKAKFQQAHETLKHHLPHDVVDDLIQSHF
jgi:hypothetical protein